MAFHETPRFPDDISYGSRGGPGYKTDLLELDSGAKLAVSRWGVMGRRRFDVSYGIKDYEQLSTLRDFYIGRQGAAHGFRFKDFSDCNSTDKGIDSALEGGQTVTNADQTIGVGDGTTVNFQLTKDYVSGSTTRTRTITKPVSGTVVISVNSVAQTEGSDFSVDYTTGIVTFNTAPTASHVIKAGFEFDTPVSFSEEADRLLQISIDSFSSGSMPEIPLDELISDTYHPDEFWYGGGRDIDPMTTDYNLSLAAGRVVRVNPTSTGHSLLLPSVSGLANGGPYFYLFNEGANSITVKDSGGSALFTLNAGAAAEIVLLNGTWFAGG